MRRRGYIIRKDRKTKNQKRMVNIARKEQKKITKNQKKRMTNVVRKDRKKKELAEDREYT